MTFHELDHFTIDPGTAQLLPLELCQERQCCLLGSLEDLAPNQAVPLAMLDAKDDETCREVEMRIGRRVQPIQLNEFEVDRAIRKGFGIRSDHSEVQTQLFLDYLRQLEFSPNQSPTKLVDDVLSVAVTRGATDIHIEGYRQDVDLRFRIEGILEQVSSALSPMNVKKIVSRIKILCGLDIAAKPQPMDGRFSGKYASADGRDRLVHFRVSIVPSANGEDCVIRVLDGGRGLMRLDDIGMAMSALHSYRTLLRCPSGLILVTGPTGCGKTTTLYASLRDIQSETKKICTVEDPVEFQIPKVNQTEVSLDVGFAQYIRAFLRQDPDVLMVGEIRDEESASLTVRAAMTGHLVLATVHTQDAVSCVSRLRTLGIDDETLSSVLLGSIAQRLLRKNCPACLEQYTPSAETFVRFYADDPGHRFYRGRGCDTCRKTGYHGRFGLFEVFTADDAITAAIGQHAPIDEIAKRARDRGYIPLVQEALQRVEAGVTTLDEVERCVKPLYFA